MTTMTAEGETLLRRVQLLEDVEAIRKLKARYLNACDQQDPAKVRECFADGKVIVDVGHLGYYDTADGFVAMFKTAACHDFVLDMHHGGNQEIDIVDDTNATGVWGLDYRNVNIRDKTVTFVSLIYYDEYRKVGGKWKISGTRSDFRTAFHCSYASGTLQALVGAKSVTG